MLNTHQSAKYMHNSWDELYPHLTQIWHESKQDWKLTVTAIIKFVPPGAPFTNME